MDMIDIMAGPYAPLVEKANERFHKKLSQLREEGKHIGKYLIGVSKRPCESMLFQIGTHEDYENHPKIKDSMIIGGEI